MKYIDKINWGKVDGKVIAVTNTNKGAKYSPIFDAHLLDSKTKQIEYLGEFGKDRILTEANNRNIRINELMGWSRDFDDHIQDNEYHIDGFIKQSYKLCAKWVIGRLLGYPSFKISKFV